MSYNIDSEECLVLDAWMYAKDVVKLLRDCEGDMAEGNFLDEMEVEAEAAIVECDPKRQIKLPNLWWYGSWSGNSYEHVLQKKIAPKIHGRVEVVFTWEGGDSQSALIIKDGVVEEGDVETRIVRRTPKKKAKR